MKRLKSIENDKVHLEVGECSCGYHFGVDSTFLDQVQDFTFECPSCGAMIYTGELFHEDGFPEACECDNTHTQNDTVCRWCYAHGRRKPTDPSVLQSVFIEAGKRALMGMKKLPTMKDLAKADWVKMETDVVERIRSLAIVSSQVDEGNLYDMIAGHLILPNLRLLAAFCESVEVTKDSENICPKCGQNFANHNDDGSCVDDTDPNAQKYKYVATYGHRHGVDLLNFTSAKKIVDLDPAEVAKALDLTWEPEREEVMDFYDVADDLPFPDIDAKEAVKQTGHDLLTIVGYQFEGEQICLNCIEEHLILNNVVFEIIKGDPDWGPGSVPICCKCGHEINTLPERPGEYCPSCNMKHTEACIDGGRCTGCGVMLTQVKPKDNMPIT